MSKQVSAAVSRPARTALQATPAFAIVAFADAWIYNMSDTQFGAAVGLLTVVLGVIQNATENRLGKGLLRRVPPTTDPVPGE